MFTTIEELHDNTTNKGFYPLTHVQAVIDNDGIDLETKLNQINNDISGKVIDYSKQYFTTVAREDGTISFNIWKSIGTDMITSISYSTDNGVTWNTINNVNDKSEHLVIDVNVNAGDKVLWKGIAKQLGYYDDDDDFGSFFSSDCEFDAKGNVMSLLYGDDFKGQTTIEESYAFCDLFYDNDEVKTCIIINTKDLSLPATTLANSCYSGMFQACTSLTEAPELPATTLANSCYSYMFVGCTSLVETPELPATTLAEHCYHGMFRGCTSLTTAPELPATTLATGCYSEMFKGCTSLKYIKCLATNISASSCTTNWVNNVAASGTFITPDNPPAWSRDNNGIPTNWNVYTESEYEVARHYEIPNVPIINAVAETYSSTAANTTTPFTASIWRVDLSDKITELYSGLTILIKVPIAGNITYGTLLRIDGVDSADDSSENLYPVCSNVTTMIGGRYAVDCIITLTFDAVQVGQKLYYNSDEAYTTIDGGSGWTKPGCWKIADYDSNTIGYALRTNNYSKPMANTTYRNRILFSSADNNKWVPANTSTSTSTTTSKTVNQTPINPFGEIVYYGTTASVTSGNNPSATNLWQQYNLTLGYSFNRTGAALTLTSWKPVYVKCAPQADGSAIIDSNTPYVQDLPTTDDGKIYIFLGVAYSATTIEMLMNHPVFYYKDGAIRMWSNASAPVTSVNGMTGTVTVQPNVKANWTTTDPNSESFIINKPTITEIKQLYYNDTTGLLATSNYSLTFTDSLDGYDMVKCYFRPTNKNLSDKNIIPPAVLCIMLNNESKLLSGEYTGSVAIPYIDNDNRYAAYRCIISANKTQFRIISQTSLYDTAGTNISNASHGIYCYKIEAIKNGNSLINNI